MVENGTLTPIDKLPGHTGAWLFDAADIEAIALEREERAS